MSVSTPAGLPPINPAVEPAAIRGGNAAAKQAYQVGLAFEQLLVEQLAQTMASTAGGTGDSGSGFGDGTSTDATGSGGLLGGGGPATSAYASLLPQALTTGVMSAGGLGVAMQIAEGIDPALRGGAPAAASGTGASSARATGPALSGGGAL